MLQAELGTTVAELRFQRCRWCHTPVFRRSLCFTCASTEMEWERSGGMGVIVRRIIPAAHHLSLVAMDEGFTVVCRVIGCPPDAVAAGVRVRLSHAIDPNRRDVPVVELADTPFLKTGQE